MVSLLATEDRDPVAIMPLDERIHAVPMVGVPYDSVFEPLGQCDDHLLKVFDLARHRECLLSNIQWKGGRQTIYGLVVNEVDPIVMLACDESTVCVSSPPLMGTFAPHVVELGACTGAMAIGPMFVGARVAACVDNCNLACQHLRLNQHGAVLEADLLDPATTRCLHQTLDSTPHTSLFGFPCQPYSSQGSQRHQLDPRSKVFWAGLRSIFLLQSQAAILECVVGASCDAAIRQGLESLAECMGWRVQDVVLKLEDQWPMHRRRWWVILFPLTWGHPALESWPVSFDHPTIGHVLPFWGLWDDHVEDSLSLTSREFEDFRNPQYGHDNRFLTQQHKCQTVLHSYANTHQACPCGCRLNGFSTAAFEANGLRGFFVKSQRTGMPRFLHPLELATLLTIPLSVLHLSPPRSALCLLGQVAAPLQSLWLYLHLIRCASSVLPSIKPLDPLAVIHKYKAEIVAQLQNGFPFGVDFPTRDFQLFHHDGAPVHLLSCGSSTIAQLLQAESINLEWGTTGAILSPSGTPLPLTEPLSLEGGELTVQINQTKQELPKPIGLLMVAIVHEDAFFVSMIAPGTFVFQLLWEHGLPTDLLFTSDSGTLLGSDYRLWHSLRLESLSRSRFPTIVAKGTLALVPPRNPHDTSAGGPSCGLDAFAVWEAMLDLTYSTSCCVVHPCLVADVLVGQKAFEDGFLRLGHHHFVALIFQVDHHWSLLFGVIIVDGILWVHYDGLDHASADKALWLGHKITQTLGLRTLGFSCRCHFAQHDDFTCGTIALLHLAAALGLRGYLPRPMLDRLHTLLCRRNHKTSWISLEAVPLDSLCPHMDFVAQGTVVDTPDGLSNRTMWQAMKNLIGSADIGSRVLLIAPFRVSDSLQAVTQAIGDFLVARPFVGDEGAILAFVEHHGHWILMVGEPCGFPVRLTWTFYDGLCHLQSHSMRVRLTDLVTRLSACLQTPITAVHFRCEFVQNHRTTCGTIAILHLGSILGQPISPTDDEIWDLHMDLLQTSEPGDFQAFGEDDKVIVQLTALLTNKGVPAAVVNSRVHQIVQKLGRGDLLKAVTSNNPWSALKTLASKPGHTIQLVHKDELEAYINKKAKEKHGADISTKKKLKSKPPAKTPPVWSLDPKLLQLVPGHFKDSEGGVLPQIDITQVTADARGIAVCNVTEARPYLSSSSISTDALALLALDEIPTTERGTAAVSTMRYPVVFEPTRDPLLVHGCLVQLGDVQVNRHRPQDPVSTMDISCTQVIKLQVFRDELDMEWTSFVQSPLKCLFQCIPLLRLCTVLSCDHKCGSYHATVEEPLDTVVHETWGRRFASVDGRTQSAVDAALFTIFLRVAKQVVDDLLPFTIPGIYFEPRCDLTKQPDSTYSVIWVPGATREIAMHKLKLLTHGIALVRMKTRYGVRALSSLEAAAHAELRPGDDFIKVAVKLVFRLHPLPHGLQRTQLVKLLKEWGWAAKPLQPARGSFEGGAWEIGASDHPKCNVLPAFGQDVLITLLSSCDTTVAPSIVGPKRVQQHPQNQALGSKPAVDPWTSPTADPWAKYVSTSSPAVPAQKRLDSFAAQLKSDIAEQVTEQLQMGSTAPPAATPVDAATIDRMNKLEVGVAELQAQGSQFRKWFDDTGARMAAQDAQIAQVQSCLQQQQSDLHAVRQEVHSSADTLHSSLATSMTQMQTQLTDHMATQLQTQMGRFEQLLFAKKPRTD